MTESFFDMLFRRRNSLVYVGDLQINGLAKERRELPCFACGHPRL
jgi:hypothetical protein